MVLEKTLASPLDCKEIQPVHSEGDQPWDFFGRNDAKAETPVLCPQGVSGPSSSCVWNPRVFADDARGGSAPSCCAFTHRVAFEEGSGHRNLSSSLKLSEDVVLEYNCTAEQIPLDVYCVRHKCATRNT